MSILLHSEWHSCLLTCARMGQLKRNPRLFPVLLVCVLFLGDRLQSRHHANSQAPRQGTIHQAIPGSKLVDADGPGSDRVGWDGLSLVFSAFSLGVGAGNLRRWPPCSYSCTHCVYSHLPHSPVTSEHITPAAHWNPHSGDHMHAPSTFQCHRQTAHQMAHHTH